MPTPDLPSGTLLLLPVKVNTINGTIFRSPRNLHGLSHAAKLCDRSRQACTATSILAQRHELLPQRRYLQHVWRCRDSSQSNLQAQPTPSTGPAETRLGDAAYSSSNASYLMSEICRMLHKPHTTIGGKCYANQNTTLALSNNAESHQETPEYLYLDMNPNTYHTPKMSWFPTSRSIGASMSSTKRRDTT